MERDEDADAGAPIFLRYCRRLQATGGSRGPSAGLARRLQATEVRTVHVPQSMAACRPCRVARAWSGRRERMLQTLDERMGRQGDDVCELMPGALIPASSS